MTAVMWVKRLVRPLIPDRLMARYRLHQHSRQIRANVDVLVGSRREQRRWLASTPDTYRVVGWRERIDSPPTDGIEILGDPRHGDDAAAAIAQTGAAAAVVAITAPPRLIGRRRTEPVAAPVAVAVRRDVRDEVGGAPDGDLVGLVRRVRDAGHDLALVPLGGAVPEPVHRRDPIRGPAVVMLAAVPMHDVGGGSRTTQLALEMVRRGITVVYVSVFGSDEGTDLGLRFVHPLLEQYRADEIDPAALDARATTPGWALLEVPAPAGLALAADLRRLGWRIAYDVIDDWSDPALGGDWHDADAEDALVRDADAVVAAAPDLVLGVERHGRRATLIPNAVNRQVFGGATGPVPADFPTGDGPVLGYHGSLYGDWMDWGAIARVASERPDARVVLIGDDSKGHPSMPGNVAFLGLKAQGDLPGYVRRFDAGLVPFTVSATTHAVSPLKVFEYLACGVPVAAPPLRSLSGLDGVFVDDDLVRAIDAALRGPRPDSARALVEHSWDQRVTSLLEVLAITGGDEGDPVRVVARPVIHHPRGARRM